MATQRHCSLTYRDIFGDLHLNYIGFQKGRLNENDATHNPNNLSTVPLDAAQFLSKPGAVKFERALATWLRLLDARLGESGALAQALPAPRRASLLALTTPPAAAVVEEAAARTPGPPE